MAETVGRVDFIADLDGRNLPREARALGKKVGAEGSRAGEDFGSRFDKATTPRVQRTADTISKSLAKAVELDGSVLRKNDRQVDDFASKVTSHFREMNRDTSEAFRDMTSGIRSSFDRADARITAFSEKTRTSIARVTGDARDMSSAFELDGSVLRRSQSDADILSRQLREALDETFERGRIRVRAWGESIGTAFRRARLDSDGLVERFDLIGQRAQTLGARLSELTPKLKQHSFAWSDLSHNTRQWTLIIGAIAAGIQDLSVLSSAAGAGLFALGGALGAAVVGTGGLIAALSVLSGDMKNLPADAQGVANQFKAFKAELSGVRDTIASSAFQQMPNTFSRLQGTLKALNPEFSQLGTTVGRVFDGFSEGVKEGTTGFKVLQTFISNGTKNFSQLADVSGTWATALVRGINRANPLTEQLIGYIGKLGDRFDAFTRSRGFDEWVNNSIKTFSKLGGLLDATGRALNDLVTPDSVARTQKFLDNLTGFMPSLSKLLDTIGRLDVFGLAAELLNEFGNALEPIEGPLGDLAEAISKISSSLIRNLATALGAAAKAVAPLVQNLADFINAMPPETLDAITGAVVTLGAAFVVLRGAQAIGGLANAASSAISSLTTLGTGLSTATAGATTFSGTLGSIASKLGPLALAIALTTTEITVSNGQLQGFNSTTLGLGGTLDVTGAKVDSFSGRLQAFGQQALTTRSAARDFEASVDSLSASITANGATLDIGTEKGRANEAAIDALAAATLTLSEKTRDQTGSQAAANDVINKGREELIKQLSQFGITGQAAQDYANKLGLIPKEVTTNAQLRGDAEVKAKLDNLTKDRIVKIRGQLTGIDGSFLGKRQYEFATGGTVYGPTRALVGEAGPEAIVPLNRPLSKVDPSVRWLSAIAQGKDPAMAGGGIAGAQSRTVIFEAGAIVVQGADDPRRAALEVADEVAERIGS